MKRTKLRLITSDRKSDTGNGDARYLNKLAAKVIDKKIMLKFLASSTDLSNERKRIRYIAITIVKMKNPGPKEEPENKIKGKMRPRRTGVCN
jgi:SOS response regulatory protein OraA/RecX